MTSKLGMLVRGVSRDGALSGTAKEMMSTMLETSFMIFSGILSGRSLPVSLRLHKYIANANSGNRSFPDFVVSDKCLDYKRVLCKDHTIFERGRLDSI